MADEIYNSSFTGLQIDEAISDVRTNKTKWNEAAEEVKEKVSADYVNSAIETAIGTAIGGEY